MNALPQTKPERLKSALLDFFGDEPKGPTCGPIASLHRGHDGYISFHSKEGERWKNLACIRADALESMFPQFREAIERDAYFSINAYGIRAAEAGKKVTKRLLRGSDRLRYLNACHVDIDHYRLGLSAGQVLGQVYDAQKAGLIPSPSVYADSGRGVWLFFFLKDKDNPQLPVRATVENKRLLLSIQRALHQLFLSAGADANARAATTVTRIPGSVNSKADERVRWLIAGEGNSPYVYTLPDLARFFDVPLVREAGFLPVRSHPNRVRGWQALHTQRLEQFRLLREMRGQFCEGHRGRAALIYGKLLRGNRYSPVEIITELHRFGSSDCNPSMDSKAIGYAFTSAAKREQSYQLANQTIADWLEITPSESDALRETFGDKAWPFAGQRVAQAVTVTVDRDGYKRVPKVQARREALLGLLEKHPRATLRELADKLRAAGIETNQVTVMRDMKVLGVGTRAMEKRNQAKRMKQAQASLHLVAARSG